MIKLVKRHDRQKLRSQIEAAKRSLPYFAEVINFGWFFIDPNQTDKEITELLYREAAEFTETYIPQILAEKYEEE
jgi:hypothetical protein